MRMASFHAIRIYLRCFKMPPASSAVTAPQISSFLSAEPPTGSSATSTAFPPKLKLVSPTGLSNSLSRRQTTSPKPSASAKKRALPFPLSSAPPAPEKITSSATSADSPKPLPISPVADSIPIPDSSSHLSVKAPLMPPAALNSPFSALIPPPKSLPAA